jgi:hypothetical protein
VQGEIAASLFVWTVKLTAEAEAGAVSANAPAAAAVTPARRVTLRSRFSEAWARRWLSLRIDRSDKTFLLGRSLPTVDAGNPIPPCG